MKLDNLFLTVLNAKSVPENIQKAVFEYATTRKDLKLLAKLAAVPNLVQELDEKLSTHPSVMVLSGWLRNPSRTENELMTALKATDKSHVLDTVSARKEISEEVFDLIVFHPHVKAKTILKLIHREKDYVTDKHLKALVDTISVSNDEVSENVFYSVLDRHPSLISAIANSNPNFETVLMVINRKVENREDALKLLKVYLEETPECLLTALSEALEKDALEKIAAEALSSRDILSWFENNLPGTEGEIAFENPMYALPAVTLPEIANKKEALRAFEAYKKLGVSEEALLGLTLIPHFDAEQILELAKLHVRPRGRLLHQYALSFPDKTQEVAELFTLAPGQTTAKMLMRTKEPKAVASAMLRLSEPKNRARLLQHFAIYDMLDENTCEHLPASMLAEQGVPSYLADPVVDMLGEHLENLGNWEIFETMLEETQDLSVKELLELVETLN